MTGTLPSALRSRLAVGALAVAAILPFAVAGPTFAHGTASGGTSAQSHAGDHDRDDHGHGAAKVRFFRNPGFTCPTGAQPAQGAARFGFAILNTTAAGKLNVTVVLRHALPNATYDIWVNQDPGACPLSAPTKAGALTTNGRGNGAAHLSIPLVSGAKHFWVSAVSGTDVLRTPAADLTLKHSS